MSTLFQIILLVVPIGGFGLMFWLLSRKSSKDTGQDDKIKQVHDEIEKIKNEMKGSLEKNLEFIQKQSYQTSNIVKDVTSYKGNIVWDSNKPDGTLRKLMDVSKLHSLGWREKIGFKEGIAKVYESYAS